MFRTQTNPMDDAVVKATDENLVNENWEYILDVCDKVSTSPSGPQQAVAALIKRLAHRNANVQLYTLELANALSQNCGPNLHRELASRAFTEALLRLASDRNTHAQVKQKVLERMGVWTEEFGRSPEFGIMEQAYQKLRTSQPGLMPPSKPGKREISSEDRRKEDDELQMALALSVQDNSKAKTNGKVKEDDELPAQPTSSAQPQGTTAATVSRVRALYDFTPSEPGELAFRKNDIIAVLASVYKDWWEGSLRGQTGIFPLNYVEKLQDPTKEELERDAQMEAEVFGEIKNVEKLLALLSVRTEGSGNGRRGEREEEEISELYQRTLSIRPKLIELIGRYSQKKDDFTQLNEKFIKARRDYEALLESSMAQPQQYQQQQYPIRPRQASGPMYPPQGYNQQIPPQGMYSQPPAGGYGPPPQQQYNTQQQPPPQQPSQSHPGQDAAQRFYTPAPAAEAPNQAGFPGSPFTSPGGLQPQNGPAAFHFIPGGVHAQSDQVGSAAIRRKPSPQSLAQVVQPPSEMGSAAPAFNAPGLMQAQARPNSIHTLNNGNPQELATGGYESPIDNRRSYPPAALAQQAPQTYQQQPLQPYQSQTPQPQQNFQNQPQHPQQAYPNTALQQPSHPPYDYTQQPPQQSAPQNTGYAAQPPQSQDILSKVPVPAPLQPQRHHAESRPRTDSIESPISTYAGQAESDHMTNTLSSQTSQHFQPAAPINSIASLPSQQQTGYQSYQAYNPNAQQQAPSQAVGPSAPSDPGDFYR